MTKIIGISGWSGSGKTQLIEKLIKFFIHEYNLKVCALKHAHSSFEIDHKGKDSYKFFEAGANKVIISSSKKWVMINKVKKKEPTLEELLINIEKNIDIVLVEGWKFSKIKKIEVYRHEIKKPLLSNTNQSFIAIASTSKKINIDKKIPILNLNDTSEIGDFIIKYLNIKNV